MQNDRGYFLGRLKTINHHSEREILNLGMYILESSLDKQLENLLNQQAETSKTMQNFSIVS